ncbi:MAG: flagellar hook-basal body complex protein, partial [Deferribacteraceae bacterium]|nr:flagellar hook-basal body complex protein [Deferribacteraceae bacterium]
VSLLTKDGTDLDLRSNDKVRVKAHIALTTSISDIANKEGQPVNMVPGKAQLTMTVGGTLFTLSYVSTAGAIGNGNFSTVQDLIDELNFIFSNNPEFGAPGDTVASLSGGKLTISCDPATPSFKIDSFSATSGYLNNILLPLQGTYSGNSKESNEMFFQQDLNVGNDFKSLGELAAQIDGVINGSVISGGEFRAEYLDNNFGLRNGDQVEMYINGNLSTFTYRGGTADPALNEFHTVNDFAQLMRITAGGTLTVRVTGNSFDVQVVGAGPVTISGIATLRAPAFAISASPYLEGVLSVLEGAVLDPITPVVRVDEISGKGRISYSMDSGSTQTLSGFTVYNLTDGNFDDNIMVFDPGHRTGATLLPGQSTASYQFFTNATEDTLLLDLFNKQGQSFAFTEGVTTMNFNASIDNKPLTAANSYTVDINSTVNDMMNALEVYLGLGPSFNMKKNVTIMDGIMYVVGEKGAANNIKGLNLSAEPQNTYNIFTNFGVSVSNTQDASGGRFVTDMTIYDGQGNEHDIKFDFAMFNYEKNEWSVRISCDDPYAKVRLEGVTTNELIIRFNADGTPSYMYDRYAVPMHIISNPTLSFSPGNGSSPMSGIALHLGTTGKYDGFVISNARNSLTRNDQDGNALGVLMEKLFNPAGEIVGYYSNGQIRILGQVALATFENNQGLLKVGDTMFAETGNSGQAVIGTPQSGSRGGIASSALENSNVDLSAEFVNMIITERGFQANSRVVTTSDEMIQELLNMKR